MPNPIINTRTLFGGIVYDPLSISYFTRAGITNKAEKTASNNLVLSIRSNTNIYNSLINGALFLISPTSVGAAYHNLMNSTFILANGTAPSFATTGFTFNGTTQFLKTGIVPNTHLTLNSSTAFYYIRNNSGQATVPWGSINSATQEYYAQPRNTLDQSRSFFYNNATVLIGANTDSSGYFFHSVTDANSRNIRRNGVSLANDDATVVAGTQPTQEIYLGARNNNGTADAFCSYNIATAGQTTIGLSTADCDTLYGFLQTYNANVISGGR